MPGTDDLFRDRHDRQAELDVGEGRLEWSIKVFLHDSLEFSTGCTGTTVDSEVKLEISPARPCPT